MDFTVIARDNKVKLGPEQKDKFDKWICNRNGNRILVSFDDLDDIRSLNINKYYFLLLKLLSFHTGYNKSSLHDIFKIQLWGYDIIEYDGIKMEVPPRSRDKSEEQFLDLVFKVYNECIDSGLEVPTHYKIETLIKTQQII